ncbi:MAG: precorrin-3B C(17)-methyltransferase [Desulfatibacillaceae bacterium]
MSLRAREVISGADCIAGYTTYVDLVRPLIEGRRIISTGMRKEVERVWAAIECATSGSSCALVCSGDPGIYAMAGLVFELCRKNSVAVGADGLTVEVVPGIPALSAGAALLGAPLMHDFATISLSDLLTPWEVIEKRITAAAGADFVLAIYNPRSKKRDWQLGKARSILLEQRSPDTPVGVVTGAMRDNQSVTLTTLGSLDESIVGMQTIVFVGNSRTFVHDGHMVTPRGYGDKYDLERGDG